MVMIQTEIDQSSEELVIRIPDHDRDDELEEFRTPIFPDTEDLELVDGLTIWGSKTDGWAVDSEVRCSRRLDPCVWRLTFSKLD